MFCYMIEVSGVEPDALLGALERVARPEVREDAMNAGEKLRLEGRLQGQRRLILRLLRSKFEPLPAEIEARVTTADEGTLDAWADAFVRAERLEDVFGEEAP